MLSSCNQATFKCSHLGWVDEELETQGRRGEGEGEFCPHFDGGGGGGREDRGREERGGGREEREGREGPGGVRGGSK